MRRGDRAAGVAAGAAARHSLRSTLEFAHGRCYISAMATSGGWMRRITGPVLD